MNKIERDQASRAVQIMEGNLKELKECRRGREFCDDLLKDLELEADEEGDRPEVTIHFDDDGEFRVTGTMAGDCGDSGHAYAGLAARMRVVIYTALTEFLRDQSKAYHTRIDNLLDLLSSTPAVEQTPQPVGLNTLEVTDAARTNDDDGAADSRAARKVNVKRRTAKKRAPKKKFVKKKAARPS